jgi:hypothetical protein
MERFEHPVVPLGDRCIVRTKGFEKVPDNRRVHKRHIAGTDKDLVAFYGKGAGVEPADGPEPLADVARAGYPPDILKPDTLVGVSCHNNDIFSNSRQCPDQSFDEGLSFAGKEIFLPAFCPARLAACKDDRGPHVTGLRRP